MLSWRPERLYRAAYGDDCPAGINPSDFYSLTTLRRLVHGLKVRPGNTLADLGCGVGGTGLLVAQQLGTDLIGIDISVDGVALARNRAAESELGERTGFQVGDFTATGLPETSCDAVMSLDVFLFVPDKTAAARPPQPQSPSSCAWPQSRLDLACVLLALR